MKPALTIVCADVGSVGNGNFGWWSSEDDSGCLPSTLAAHVAVCLNREDRVALGFECPLFVPVRTGELHLGRAREGESNRPWSAGAGVAVMGQGLVQIPWILAEVQKHLVNSVACFLDWDLFEEAGKGLFLWEAFVSGKVKGESHIDDARLAVEAFDGAMPDPRRANRISLCSDVHSLVGAALLRTGWTSDLSFLRTPALVIGPDPKNRKKIAKKEQVH